MQIDPVQVRDVYEDIFRSSDTALNQSDAQLRFLKLTVPDGRDSYILDAGCGNGRYSEILLNSEYRQIYAIDLLESVCVEGLSYSSASLDQLPFSDAQFDFVYCFSAAFYIDPPALAVAELCRVLKPGGRLLISAHTKWSVYTLLRKFKRDVLRLAAMRHLSGVKFYSAGYYLDALQNQNMEIEILDGWSPSTKTRCKKSSGSVPTANPSPGSLKRVSFSLLQRLRSETAYHSIIVGRKSTRQ